MNDWLKESFEKVQNAKKCINDLYDYQFIDSEEKKRIQERIDKFSEQNFIFITKPFKTCDSVGIHFYRFMKSLQRNLD